MKVRTMRGHTLDMSQLISKNEKAIALGNASMNARGDILGARGEIVKRREQVAQEYYASNPKAVKQVALRDISSEVFVSPAEAAAKHLPKLDAAPEAKQSEAAPTPPRKRKIEDRDN
jgi:hypothetical protein